ncbi:DEKNAAC100467 [Brettanomyces naardenensis]|uniref:DEKNAAC100468 n=1 Tax=Brettanomyces naardenensis TaxID=13370 RepID=A0A448YE95_BRENA|nr:DEKNAAC100467 [Brettanomyces naardenensis]
MDTVDFESTGPDFGAVFKAINLAVATIAFASGFTQLFSGIGYFFQGLYVAALGVIIGYLEFKVPPQLYSYCSSFFSFLGRGLIYILIAILNIHGSALRIICAFFVFVVGISYVVLEFVQSIQPPENMQGEQGLSTDGLDDVI